MAYRVIRGDAHSWEERPNVPGQEPRRVADITTSAELNESRARLWRYPPHARGRRHFEAAQEEVFVVLSGTLTMMLGEPPVRVDLEPQSVASVEPGTGIQLRNETDAEVVVFVYGAPPVAEPATLLEDIEL